MYVAILRQILLTLNDRTNVQPLSRIAYIIQNHYKFATDIH